MDHAEEHDNLIHLDDHPRAWTHPGRIERFLKNKRVEAPVAAAAARFAAAVAPLCDQLPRTWTAPLIASLPEQPSAADLAVAVAGAARYFEYLDVQGALPRSAVTMCEYDLLAAAHIVEEMTSVGLDRDRMVLEERMGAAEKVRRIDARRAGHPDAGIAGDVSWLGGWVQRRGTWVVLWVPAGGGVAVAGDTACANERAEMLAGLFMRAFMRAAKARRAPARLGVFSPAQEQAMRDFARQVDINLLPVYRLRAISPLRFWADELLLG